MTAPTAPQAGAASTQFDVTFFPLTGGQHDSTANDIGAKLLGAGSENWAIAWILTTSEGIMLILQRPTPAPPTPRGSVGGYSSSGG